MFQDVSEVREFLSWCLSHGVQTVEVGGVKVTFAPIAVAHAASQLRAPERPAEPEHERAPSEPDPNVDPATGYLKEDLFASSE